MNFRIIAVAVLIVGLLHGQEKKMKDSIELNELVLNAQSIFPKDKKFLQRAGASIYISPEQLQEFNYANINRVLEGESGVFLYEESGFGLRPNISIRGTEAERSAKINIMEDGVPIAPAPYSASAAYYFPNIARMNGIEILKGSGQIKYGPNTSGGSINLLSQPIPNRLSIDADLSAGSYESFQSNVAIGNRIGKWGFVVQYLNQSTKGFKKLPNQSETGFDKNDIMGKISYRDNVLNIPTLFQLKYQYSNEDGKETYLGLSDEDFKAHPYERYVASSLDNMKNEHQQWVFSTEMKISPKLNWSFDAYNNHFHRNWNKAQSADAGNGAVSLGKIFSDLNTYHNEFEVLRGNFEAQNAIYLRNNNRTYDSRGLQTHVHFVIPSENISHEFQFGARYHYDDMDRFQWEDQYQLAGNSIGLVQQGQKGSQSNRIDDAKAFSSYLQYQLHYQKWWVNAGLRFEDIHLRRRDYAENLERVGAPAKVRENVNSVWIPGMSILFKNSSKSEFFAGVHKGFSPSGSKPNEKAESSWNYELGTRFKNSNYSFEIVGFINDFSNLLGSDLSAAGGEGNNDLLNAGAVKIHGIESSFRYAFRVNDHFKIPIRFNYTYQKSSFKDTFDSELYGEVYHGDELPNIPTNQLRVQAGFQGHNWSLYASYRNVGARRTQVGQGAIPVESKISAYGVLDVSTQYKFNPQLGAFVTMENLLKTEYAVSRVPYGLRPGLPFFLKAGISFHY